MGKMIDCTAIKISIWGLFNSVYNDASKFTEEETEFAKQILSQVQEQIDSQPIVFDMDKVVEQLKESAFIPGDRIGVSGLKIITEEKALDIVKAGGIE